MTQIDKFDIHEMCQWRFMDLDYGLEPWRAVERIAPYNDRPQVWCTKRATAKHLGFCSDH